MTILTSLRFLVVCLALIATPAVSRGEEALALAQKQAADYLAAFAKRDSVALGRLYAEDATYRFGDSDPVSGRAAIAKRLVGIFKNDEKPSLEIEVRSARFLTPDVLLESGVSRFTQADGDAAISAYTATHVRRENVWLIADVQEVSLPAADEAAGALAELEWLVGSWTVVDHPEGTLKAERSLDGRFITRTATNVRDGGSFVAAEIIGFDPQNRLLRSWTFDNEGGYGEATYRRDGDKWLITLRAVMPDGGDYSAEQVVTVLGPDRFTWESQSRILDGETLPNQDPIEFLRASGSSTP
jgi:uncharacterized protein (TIGR02246 family)